MVAHVLPHYHTILYIDADMGVVNPKRFVYNIHVASVINSVDPTSTYSRRIEEYMDEGVEISFFDRFYNWEVAAGSYIVKNTEWTQKFLKGTSFRVILQPSNRPSPHFYFRFCGF